MLQTTWNSSHFLSFTTSLIRPPRYHDHIFTAWRLLTGFHCRSHVKIVGFVNSVPIFGVSKNKIVIQRYFGSSLKRGISSRARRWFFQPELYVVLDNVPRQREIPDTQTTMYMLKDLPERNALLAGYRQSVRLSHPFSRKAGYSCDAG